MTAPPFHRFHDMNSNEQRALLLNDEEVSEYLEYMDSIFSLYKKVFDNEEVIIHKYICPFIHHGIGVWATHVFMIACRKKKRGDRNNIAIFGPVSMRINTKFDDKHLKMVLINAVLNEWGIKIEK